MYKSSTVDSIQSDVNNCSVMTAIKPGHDRTKQNYPDSALRQITFSNPPPHDTRSQRVDKLSSLILGVPAPVYETPAELTDCLHFDRKV